MKSHAVLLICLLSLVPPAAIAQEDDAAALKQDAVDRVVDSHDPALSVHIGRVYVKQAALIAARDLLRERGRALGAGAEWNPSTTGWRAAETMLMEDVDGMLQSKVAAEFWVRNAWRDLVSTHFNGEQADEIAVHFQSEGGQLQRRVIEWFVGELTLQTYTFTDRLRYGVPGSEKEMKDLQEVTYARIFPGIQDFTPYENAVRFASTDPGVKYFKTMVMQGVHALHVYLEQRADEARAMIRSRATRVDPYITQSRRDADANG